MSWESSEAVAKTALSDSGFFGRGGYEVEELALIIERDLLLEELMDTERLEEAADRIRTLTRIYILERW